MSIATDTLLLSNSNAFPPYTLDTNSNAYATCPRSIMSDKKLKMELEVSLHTNYQLPQHQTPQKLYKLNINGSIAYKKESHVLECDSGHGAFH